MTDIFDLQSAMATRIKTDIPEFKEVKTFYGMQAMQSAMGVVNQGSVKGGIGVKNPACLLTLMQASGYEPHMTGQFDADLRMSAFVLADGADRERIATRLAFKLYAYVPFKQWGIAGVKVPTDLRLALLNVPSLNTLGVFGFIVSWFQPVVLGVAREHYSIPRNQVTIGVNDPAPDLTPAAEGVIDPNTQPPPYPIPEWKLP